MIIYLEMCLWRNSVVNTTRLHTAEIYSALGERMHEVKMHQKMCLSVCACVSAHIHALKAYKQQYRFNYRRPSSCLSLCVNMWVYWCVFVQVCLLLGKWGDCVSGWVSSVGILECNMYAQPLQSLVTEIQHLYCCRVCACVAICVDGSTFLLCANKMCFL